MPVQQTNKTELELTDLENPEQKEPSVIGTTISAAWSPTNEKIAVEWCDIAQCYKWLHYHSHQKYSTLQMWFTIPAIIFSTISGTASFAQASLPISMQVYAPMVIGSVNIFIGILTTIQQYLKISEYNESHRISAISWDKFARNIKIELAKHPDDRAEDAGHFLKSNREEFDRLMETSPSIPPEIIDEFQATFTGESAHCIPRWCKKKTPEQKQKKLAEMHKQAERFEALKKPDICNIIISADEDKYKWTKEDEGEQEMPNDVLYSVVSEKISKIQSEMARKSMEIREEYETKIRQQEEARKAEELAKLRQEEARQEAERIRKETERMRKEAEKRIADSTQKINDYVQLFNSNVGRNPEPDEIRESLRTTIEVDILDKYLETYGSDV
jgi:hypothetical protein